jgi:hypothetical protein
MAVDGFQTAMGGEKRYASAPNFFGGNKRDARAPPSTTANAMGGLPVSAAPALGVGRIWGGGSNNNYYYYFFNNNSGDNDDDDDDDSNNINNNTKKEAGGAGGDRTKQTKKTLFLVGLNNYRPVWVPGSSHGRYRQAKRPFAFR